MKRRLPVFWTLDHSYFLSSPTHYFHNLVTCFLPMTLLLPVYRRMSVINTFPLCAQEFEINRYLFVSISNSVGRSKPSKCPYNVSPMIRVIPPFQWPLFSLERIKRFPSFSRRIQSKFLLKIWRSLGKWLKKGWLGVPLIEFRQFTQFFVKLQSVHRLWNITLFFLQKN